MKRGGRYRTITLVLLPLTVLSILIFLKTVKTVLVLEVRNPSITIPVSEGDILFHEYTDSMYGARVREKFRIEDNCFRLFHVVTDSGAVLAYLGIEGKHEPNVERIVTEFTIPCASIGDHAIEINGANVRLHTGPGRDGRIRVKVRRLSVYEYLLRLIRS